MQRLHRLRWDFHSHPATLHQSTHPYVLLCQAMGFTDTEVNRRLLAAYGGDVEDVITLLVNSGGDPNLLEVTHESHHPCAITVSCSIFYTDV